MKFLILFLLFGLSCGLEDKDEAIQTLTKLVYDMKTEMDDLKIRIKGNDCNCERLIGLINNNTLDILNLTSSIDTVKLDVQKNVQAIDATNIQVTTNERNILKNNHSIDYNVDSLTNSINNNVDSLADLATAVDTNGNGLSDTNILLDVSIKLVWYSKYSFQSFFIQYF